MTSESCGGSRVKRFLYSDKLLGDKDIVIRDCEGRGVVERGQLPLDEPDLQEAGRDVEDVEVMSIEAQGCTGSG